MSTPKRPIERPQGSSTGAHSAPTATASTSHPVATSESSSSGQTRLYVGNLAASVDEYALLKAFGRFGKLKKLDFLFHKTGPKRGQPRGYAFVEYESPDDAAHALHTTTTGAGATLRGQKLSVAFASNRPEEPDPGPRPRHRPEPIEDRRTALSTALAAATPTSVEGRIAAMEAQLASLDGKDTHAASSQSRPNTGSGSPRGVQVGHHRLPQRPLQGTRRSAPYHKPTPKHSRPTGS